MSDLDSLPVPNQDAIHALYPAAAAGDADALEHLLTVYHDRLAGLVRRKIGVDWQGKIDPDDVLQEAYIDVFAGIGHFVAQDDESFFRWAARIVDHRFIDHVRRWRAQKRDVARETPPSDRSQSRHASLLERCLPELRTPSSDLRRAEAVGALMACIARLPDDYRVVVQRAYLNEEPLAAVAADLGRSEDAVRRLGARAIDKLNQCLQRASRYLSSAG
jgi:RNA polymerase sigma-70 factor, ECF subfamily